MRFPTLILALLCLALLGGCLGDPNDESPTLSSTEQPVATIGGGVDVGNGPCYFGGGTCRHFTIWAISGNFIESDPNYEFRPIVYCDGRAYSRLGGTAAVTCSPALGNCGATQINIEVRHNGFWPEGQSCAIRLQRSIKNYDSMHLDPQPTYSNLHGPIAKFRILSAAHLSSTPRQAFRLYGDFGPGPFTPSLVCNSTNLSYTVTIDAWSSSWLDLSFPNPALKDCVIRVIRVTDAIPSTPFHVRLAPALPLPARFGAYYWSGFQDDRTASTSLDKGTQALRAAGFQTGRLRIAPGVRLAELAGVGGGFYENTGVDPARALSLCPISAPFLGCGIRLPEYQDALAALPVGTPTQPVYVPLLAYDSATTGAYFLNAANLVNAAFLQNPVNAESIIEEYAQLTYALYETQSGTGRIFILLNWESENQAPTPAYIDALKIWLSLRKQGVARGRQRAQADHLLDGPNPPHVADGIEFGVYRPVSTPTPVDNGLELIKDICPEYASWSSWYGSNAGTLDQDIPTLRGAFASWCATPPTLILGELGPYPHTSPVPVTSQYWHFRETVRSAYRANVALSILWHGYSFGADGDEAPGLLSSFGADTPHMTGLRDDIINYAATGLMPPQPIQINGMVDRGINTSYTPVRRYFELYGWFPSPSMSTYSVRMTCDGPNSGIGVYAEISYISSGQINFFINNLPFGPSGIRFCKVWVQRGTERSPEFGPRGLCNVTRGYLGPPSDPAPYTPCL